MIVYVVNKLSGGERNRHGRKSELACNVVTDSVKNGRIPVVNEVNR